MKKDGKAVAFLSLGIVHNRELVKATELLTDARNYLLYARSDFGGYREEAIQHVNCAVDEIRAFEETGRHNRYGQ